MCPLLPPSPELAGELDEPVKPIVGFVNKVPQFIVFGLRIGDALVGVDARFILQDVLLHLAGIVLRSLFESVLDILEECLRFVQVMTVSDV